jgi:hypothetical protein
MYQTYAAALWLDILYVLYKTSNHIAPLVLSTRYVPKTIHYTTIALLKGCSNVTVCPNNSNKINFSVDRKIQITHEVGGAITSGISIRIVL